MVTIQVTRAGLVEQVEQAAGVEGVQGGQVDLGAGQVGGRVTRHAGDEGFGQEGS